jgi:CBS domain-containing protein
MRVRQFMSKNAQTVLSSDSADDAWDQMRSARIHHLVVVDNGNVVGVVSTSDLGGPNGQSVRRGALVSDLMNPNVVRATTNTSVREAANLMRGHSTDCLAIVQDERVVGIVTALDLLELLGRGAQRPPSETGRRFLKDRGKRPHGQVAAELASRAKQPVAR